MKKQLLSCLLAVLMLLLCACGSVRGGQEQHEEVQNTVHEDVQEIASETNWTLYDNGLFVYTGSTMPYILNHDEVPWFSYMDQIREVVIEKPVPKISEFAFLNCEHLERVTMPEGVRRISLSAFEGCSALKTIKLPASLETIDFWAFSGCGLEEIVVPGMTELSNYAFQSCSALRRVVISEGTGEIGFDVFEDCSALEMIYLPSSLNAIGVCTFRGCSSLMDVWYGGSQLSWDHIQIDGYNDPLLDAQLHPYASPEDVIA